MFGLLCLALALLVTLLGATQDDSNGTSAATLYSAVELEGEFADDFDTMESVRRAQSETLCAIMAKHKSYLNFAFDEGSGTCQLGLAVSVRPSNETNNPNAYGIKIEVSPTALLTMGEDDHPMVVFSDGSVCRSQDSGVPPLPPAEWEDRNKGIVESGGILYACGGDGISSCMKWDLRSNDVGSWTPIDSLPQDTKVIKGGMVAAEDGSRLLLLPQGGPNVYVYQVEEDSWSIGGALEVLVNNCGVVLMEGTLYVLGGKDLNAYAQVTTVQTLSIQTPAEDFQRHDHAMKFGRTLMGCAGGVRLGDETGILCAGGYNNYGGRKDQVQFLPLLPAHAPCRELTALGTRTSDPMALSTGAGVLLFGGTASANVPLSRVLKLDKEEERFKMVHGLTMPVNLNRRSFGLTSAATYFRRCFV